MARKLKEDEVLRSLRKKRDIKIAGKNILVTSNGSKRKAHDLGNGTWGKIDFLVNHCGYYQYFVLKK